MSYSSRRKPSFSHSLQILLLLLSMAMIPDRLSAEEESDPGEIELLDFEVWRRERGYWFGEYTFLNASGTSDYKATDNPTSGQYNYRKYYGFINLQVKGSELKQRNIFLRPALDLEAKDLDADGIVSINELDQFGFSSPYDYQIDLVTKIATPMQNGAGAGLLPFNYTEGTEKTFTADQSATDNSGNLSGSYFGIPTTTTIIGDDTVLYRVGAGTLYQNQLTTLPGNGTRVRTAQGFFNGIPTYASYYRETKFEDDVDEHGAVTKTAKEKFLEKLAEFRELHNVPEANRTTDVETFFTTGLEEPDEVAPATTLAEWKSYYFTPAELADPGISGDSADADLDGMDTMLEYALVSDPTAFDPQHLPELVTVTDDGTDYLGLRYRRRLGSSDISYRIESSSDLVNWLPEKSPVPVDSIDNGDGSVTTTIRLTDPMKGDAQLFLRLKITAVN